MNSYRPEMRAELVIGHVDDEVLVYDPVSDRTTVLNWSAAAVLERCDGERTVAEIIAAVGRAVPAPPGDIGTEIEDTIRSLSANGLLTHSPSRNEWGQRPGTAVAAVMKDRFTSIFESNTWGGLESKSGPGSALESARNVVRELPHLFSKYRIGSVLDLPCGDFNWMRWVDLGAIKYIGADVVDALVEANRFNHPDRTFVILDIATSRLPEVDLILVRDCLVHLPLGAIKQALVNIKHSGIKYLLTTNFSSKSTTNTDIRVGEWRRLNLENSPFNFPPPLETIVEGLGGDYADKSLCLWPCRLIPDLA